MAKSQKGTVSSNALPKTMRPNNPVRGTGQHTLNRPPKPRGA